MKNQFLLAFALVLGLFTGCSEADIEVEDQTVNLTITPTVEKTTTKDGTYTRGDAPVYIKGVQIVMSQPSNSMYINQWFDFVDHVDNNGPADGQGTDIVIEQVKVGENFITVNTKPEYATITGKEYTISASVTEITAVNIDTDLKEQAPIYAEYHGEKTAQVEISGTNEETVAMEPQTGRVSIAFVGKQNLEYKVNVNYKPLVGSALSYDMEIVGNDVAKALVFNDSNIDVNVTMNVTIYARASGSSNYTEVKSYQVPAEVGVNKTILYTYDNGDIMTNTLGLNFTWTEITNNPIDETID